MDRTWACSSSTRCWRPSSSLVRAWKHRNRFSIIRLGQTRIRREDPDQRQTTLFLMTWETHIFFKRLGNCHIYFPDFLAPSLLVPLFLPTSSAFTSSPPSSSHLCLLLPLFPPFYLFISKLLSDLLLRTILVFMESSELLLIPSPHPENLRGGGGERKQRGGRRGNKEVRKQKTKMSSDFIHKIWRNVFYISTHFKNLKRRRKKNRKIDQRRLKEQKKKHQTEKKK